jgi:hypothetical protein
MTRRIVVTDGNRRPIGSVIDRGSAGFEALDLNEVSGGVFASEAAAARALWLIVGSGWISLGEAVASAVRRSAKAREQAASGGV